MAFFPGGVIPEKSSTTSKSKKPCKYGPRDGDGYCPKKPKAPKKAAKKKPCKYGARGADGYCPKKGSVYISEKGLDVSKDVKRTVKTNVKSAVKGVSKDAATLAAVALMDKSRRAGAAAAVKALASSNVKDVLLTGGKQGAKGILGFAAIAFFASYYITKYLTTYYPKKRAEQNAAAGEAADAYRLARMEAARQQGSPLTKEQLKVMSDKFKEALTDIGVQWPLRQ